MIGTLPIDCDLTHGDLKLATITIGIPLHAGDVETREDGAQYVTLAPDFTDGWFERALTDAVTTVTEDNAAHTAVQELTGGAA